MQAHIEIKKAFGHTIAGNSKIAYTHGIHLPEGKQVVALSSIHRIDTAATLSSNVHSTCRTKLLDISIASTAHREHYRRILVLTQELLHIIGDNGRLVILQVFFQLTYTVQSWLHFRTGHSFYLLTGFLYLGVTDGHLGFKILLYAFYILQAKALIAHTCHQAADLIQGLGYNSLILTATRYHGVTQGMRERIGIVLQQLLCLLTILSGELIRILTLWQLYTLNYESSLQQYLAVR